MGWFGMFSGYFDASHGDGVMVVAGFLAHVEAWERFDSEWRSLLKVFDIPCFHMRLYAHSEGHFKKWKGKNKLRDQFIIEAAATIKRTAIGWVSATVRNSDFSIVGDEYDMAGVFGDSPYALAGRSCLANGNHLTLSLAGNTPGEYIFEQGDTGVGKLRDLVKRDNGRLPMPIFKKKEEFVGLQAADFAAWEIHKLRTDAARPVRKSLEALFGLTNMTGTIEAKGLRHICDGLGIALKSGR